jgi:hypothetical protein
LLRFARNDELSEVATEAIQPLEGQGLDRFVAGAAPVTGISVTPVV